MKHVKNVKYTIILFSVLLASNLMFYLAKGVLGYLDYFLVFHVVKCHFLQFFSPTDHHPSPSKPNSTYSNSCQEGENVTYHFCEMYPRMRSYIHLDNVLANIDWWYIRQLQANGLILFSSHGFFSRRSRSSSISSLVVHPEDLPPMDLFHPSSSSWMKQHSSIPTLTRNLTISVRHWFQSFSCHAFLMLLYIPIVEFFFSHSIHNTLVSSSFQCGNHIVDIEQQLERRNNILQIDTTQQPLEHPTEQTFLGSPPSQTKEEDQRLYDDEMDVFPLPLLEIGKVGIHWNSWIYPIVDISIHHIRINVVYVYHYQQNHHCHNGNNHPAPFPLPNIEPRIGNRTMEEIMNFLTPEYEEEGLFPKIGTIHITNVSLAFYFHDQSSSQTKDDAMTSTPNDHLIPFFFCNNVDDGSANIQDDMDNDDDTLSTLIQNWQKKIMKHLCPALTTTTKSMSTSNTPHMNDNKVHLISEITLPDLLFSNLSNLSNELKKTGGIDQMHIGTIVKQTLLEGLKTVHDDAVQTILRDVKTSFQNWWETTLEEGMHWIAEQHNALFDGFGILQVDSMIQQQHDITLDLYESLKHWWEDTLEEGMDWIFS